MIFIDKMKELYKSVPNAGKWEYKLKYVGMGDFEPLVIIDSEKTLDIKVASGYTISHAEDFDTNKLIVMVMNNLPRLLDLAEKGEMCEGLLY
jgi:hypothetical protein